MPLLLILLLTSLRAQAVTISVSAPQGPLEVVSQVSTSWVSPTFRLSPFFSAAAGPPMINEGPTDVCGAAPTRKYINPNPAPGNYAFTWGIPQGCLLNNGIFPDINSVMFTVTLTVSVSGTIILTETRTGNVRQLFFASSGPQNALPFVQVFITPAPQDTTPPAAVGDLRVVTASTSSLAMAWTAPGDDGNTGTAASYDLRYTTAGPILTDADFNAATQVAGEPTPRPAGNTETLSVAGLAPATTYFFALKTRDEVNNASALSNSPAAKTLSVYSLSISTGDGQAGTVTKTIKIPLTVKVTDALGMAVVGATVTFSTSAAPSGAAGHRLSVISMTTAQDGTATTILTFGDHVGTYTVTAACAGCSPPSVNFTAVAELRFVISLSTDSIRPSGTETSPDQPRTTLLVTATGVSVPTDRVANYPVVLISTPVALSGGHNHDENRPTGSFEVLGNPSVYTTNTGIDGSFLLSYVSTATSGQELITANSAADSQARTTTRTLTVEVPGLVLLPTTTFYTKVGGTSLHSGLPAGAIDDNHYGAAEFNAIISSVSAQFKARFPSRTVRINDMSLPSGGIFDIGPTGSCFLDFPANMKPCKVWSKPHSFHRRGTSCDYNLDIGLPQGQKSTRESRFIKAEFSRLGVKVWPESDHWHVYLPGGGP